MNPRALTNYRPDIDGLRALSVVAVILFHAHVPGIGGGFVGVDIFFVISGFLITRLLFANRAAPLPRQLADFYLRRARRILPALLLVMAVTAAAAWALFTPAELRASGNSLALCVAMLGNYAAWNTSGYFDTPWTFTPLLHLWSISVEEQFYLAYPLALFVLLRFMPRRGWVPALTFCAVASFALCVWASEHRPVFNYYAAPTRAWELLLGAIVALRANPTTAPVRLRQWLSAAALAVIVMCVALYDSRTPFPGWYALWPCLAAATLLAADGAGGFVEKLLTFRPLVFVGLISYSLFLWHVPVLVIHRYFTVVTPGAGRVALLLAVIVIVSVGSWALIEQPLRRRMVLAGDRKFLWVMATAIIALLALGLGWSRSDGFPQRFAPEVQKVVGSAEDPDSIIIKCMRRSVAQVSDGDLCRFGPERPDNRVLLWGDSHALAALPALREITGQRGAELRFGAISSCEPLAGVLSGRGNLATQLRCAEFNQSMLAAVRRLKPRVVILIAYWTFPGSNYQPQPGLAGTGEETPFSRGVQETVRRLGADQHAPRVCLVRDVPLFDYFVPHALAMARLRGIGAGYNTLPRARALAAQESANRDFDALERRGLLHTVDPFELLCPRGDCRMLDDAGDPLYRDDNHLSAAGARFIAPVIQKCF